MNLDDLSDHVVLGLSMGFDESVVIGIAVYYDSIYFTDLAYDGLYQVSVDGGEIQIVSFNQAPSDLLIYAGKFIIFSLLRRIL